MKIIKPCILIFILLMNFPARPLAAVCDPDVTPAGSVQNAVDNASAGATICIGVGTYSEQITLKDNIRLQGEELARTIIDSGAGGTNLTFEDAAQIENLTIANGDVGISVETANGVTIRNVNLIGSTTGIQCTLGARITLENTTINDTATGVDCSSLSDVTVTNTIISNNTTDITTNQLLNPGSDFNLLYSNTTSNYPVTDPNSIYGQAPLFVDPGINDFHLQTGSPAIDAGTGTDPDGTPADIGAYGGTNSDVVPFPVQNLNAIENPPGSNDVDITWSANNAGNISGYNVYYDNDNSGQPYANILDVFNTTMTTLTGLGITPSAPTGLSATPGDRKLEISWYAVAQATGYIISYGISSGTYTVTIDVGNTTSHVIGNLTNNVRYYLVVRAYSQPTYYVAVSAYDAQSPANESKLINEASVTLSQITQGPDSAEISDIPEKTFAFPNLDDEDRCFIATAAYGSALEPRVILLRKFRNRYLLVHPFGKRLVAVYYSFSPPIADFVRQNKWLKPIVRAILLPFIGLAAFCLELSPRQQHTVMLALMASFGIMLFLFHKRIRT